MSLFNQSCFTLSCLYKFHSTIYLQVLLHEKPKMNELTATDFTRTVHQAPYSKISPTRAELSQAGKTVLITGGGTGIGKAIAKNFVLASAATIILTARRDNVLKEAIAELEKVAKAANSPTKFIKYS
jgi:FlaA1/EpsC-like NDP-sugar epimerase